MNVAEWVRTGDGATRLVVRCLGRFSLEDQSGSQLHLRTKKARALLAALALNGRPMSRDALADLLWSDRGEAQAKASLRQTIFELQHFGDEDRPILSVGRDELAIRRDNLVTDIELVRLAANDGDWTRLMALLDEAEPGLLTDLDGLDPEFDDWLRKIRGQEPERSLSAALSAVDRCRAEAGPRAAIELVTALLRFDPANEEATRSALQLDHELGDNAALYRHFHSLKERLTVDFDAAPSSETVDLFERLSSERTSPNPDGSRFETGPSIAGIVTSVAPRRARSVMPVLTVLVLAAAALAALIWSEPRQASPDYPVIVAVMPFDQKPRQDNFLAAGLWEQTRGALTRSKAFRVLGRATTEAMAQQRISPRQFLDRFGVTHLLEGTVLRSGDNVQISVALTRTSDGIAVWQDTFRGQMKEPFALQDAVANGIEGKLRARLAPDGGRRAEQIATTPEVYAMYSEARQLIASRDRANFQRAEALLRQAVKVDANYAPAWSLLGGATFFNGRIAIVDADARAEGLAAVRKALAMAPNFAPAHATLALIQGDNSRAAEPELRRAVELDPSYSEAWLWLGNSLAAQARYQEARDAYWRALELDPLLQPAVLNFFSTSADLGDAASIERLFRKLKRAEASAELIYSLQAERAYRLGDYSAALKLLSKHGVDGNGRPKHMLWLSWFESISAIGYYDAMHRVTGCPEWYAPMVSGKVLPPKSFEGKPVTPEEFWTSLFFSAPAARSMIQLGHSNDLAKLYRAGFRDADDFISQTDRRDMLPELASNVAVALRAEGMNAEADYLLKGAARKLEAVLARAPVKDASGRLALVRAAQGEQSQALAILGTALQRGWFPDGRTIALDLAREPAFAGLRGNSRFEAFRKRILDHIAKEQAELGPLKV